MRVALEYPRISTVTLDYRRDQVGFKVFLVCARIELQVRPSDYYSSSVVSCFYGVASACEPVFRLLFRS